MTTDVWLAIAHHVPVFMLLGVLAAEWALVHPGMQRPDLERLSRVDALYGLAAVAVIIAGVSRLIWGANDADFYTENPVFWLKMASFAAVGLLSIVPTVRYMRWRKALGEDANWTPSDGDV